MYSSIKVILLSQVPLPFSKIGSWTTLYKNYLSQNHKIDYIICPEPEKLFEGMKYSFLKLTFYQNLQRKFLKKKNIEYFKALDKLIIPNEKYIIQVIDNYGLAKTLKNYLISKEIDKQCYVQFFYHGFPPYNKPDSKEEFYKNIDEIILLTNDSYLEHKKQIPILPNYMSVLHNGIDSSKFTKISDSEKGELKKQLGFNDKKVFVWCSQDRPKKGLDLILNVWKKIYDSKKNIILLVIGCERREQIEGVEFLGKIPNNELPKYYQASDCYLFPTLCEEGFGLSLVEALHCGNHCIASAFGGVPEVLQYGKLGKLIDNPHSITEWESAINEFLNGNYKMPEISNVLYTMENWSTGMNKIIDDAKLRLIDKILQ